MVYTYKLIEAKLPKSGSVSAWFIDWVGAGFGALFAGLDGEGAKSPSHLDYEGK